MTKKETKRLQSAIDQEGFDYCFTSYSSWEEIKDKEFQQLIAHYVDAQDKLEKYIKSQYEKHGIEEL